MIRVACLFLFGLSNVAALPSALAAAGEPILLESVVLRPMQAAEVPAQQTGLLLQISVKEGQNVEEDQVLATLDPRAAHLAVQQALAERDQAREKAENQLTIQSTSKAIEVAEAELQRSLESVEKFPKSISQSQIDVERLTVEKLRLEKKQAEHDRLLESFTLKQKENDLAAARLALEKHRLQAPFAGTVVLVRGRVGEWVEIGAPVLRLVSVNRLRAEGFLPIQQITDSLVSKRALVGKRVTFSARIGGQQIEATGTLRFVSPEMDPVTKQVRVWAELDNSAGKLRPGGQGTMKIE